MKKLFTHIALIVIGILSIYGYSFADGVYLPEARKKIPNIPVQRTLFEYRNGTASKIPLPMSPLFLRIRRATLFGSHQVMKAK